MKNIIAVVLYIISAASAKAQNTRISDHNTIGWYNYFGTIKLSEKTGIHTEYQFRRTAFISSPQQGLLRIGFNYKPNPKVALRAGYAWVETFAYGEIPINSYGKAFTEHRGYEMLTFSDKISKIEILHRFMLEQRWIGKYNSAQSNKEDLYVFANRFRYMFKAQMPFKGQTIGDGSAYMAVYDEILIGFGKNVNENIFDQNRLGLMIGYQFSKAFKLEAGYLNQTVQLSREISGRNVFQYNNGLIINTIFNFSKKV